MKTTAPLLVDSTILNDELDLLELRLEFLSDVVDHFVVAESATAFSGHPKPLHLAENIERFAQWRDRLTVVTYDCQQYPDAWERESAARDSLLPALRAFGDQAVAILADLDELPSRSQCHNLRAVSRPTVIPLTTYYRRANWRVEYHNPWLCTAAAPVAALTENLAGWRWERTTQWDEVAGEWGAHLSYMGFTPEALAAKYQAFSHTELDVPEASDETLLAVADRYAVDHIGRTRKVGRGLLSRVPVQEWSATQRWLFSVRPEWFDLRPSVAPYPIRRFYATIVELVVTQHRFEFLDLVRGRPSLRRRAALAAEVARIQQGLDRRDLWRAVVHRQRHVSH